MAIVSDEHHIDFMVIRDNWYILSCPFLQTFPEKVSILVPTLLFCWLRFIVLFLFTLLLCLVILNFFICFACLLVDLSVLFLFNILHIIICCCLFFFCHLMSHKLRYPTKEPHPNLSPQISQYVNGHTLHPTPLPPPSNQLPPSPKDHRIL